MIWAAIFLVAAQFIAGSASAHSGHHHEYSAASRSIPAAQQLHDSNAMEIAQLTRQEKAELSLSAPDGTKLPDPPRPGTCSGVCCGNGIGCCGAVLASCPNCLPDLRAQKEIVSLVFDRRSGIDPEPLARPPRSLA